MASDATTCSTKETSWLYRPVFPESWEPHVLYSLATWINGMAFKNINFSPTGRPVIKIAEIKGGITAQTQFTDSEYDKRYFITQGDMLFSWSGQPETSIDAFYWDGPDGWLNQHVFKVLPNDDSCTPSFLFYILKYLKPNFIGIARNKQTTGLGHVTKADMQAIQVAVPDRPTQDRITCVLGKLDARIAVNLRMNRILEKMAGAIFKSWFIDFDPVHAKAEGRDTGLPAEIDDLFPDSFEESELGPIPKGWKLSKIGEHMLNYDSKRIPVSGAERAKRRGPYPYHGAAAVMDHVDDYLFDGIFLLVGEDGSVVQGNGLAVTQYVWGRIWVNNHAHVLQGKGPVSTEQLFLYFCFEPVAPYVTGAVQPKLSQGRMNQMPFVFPRQDVCVTFAETIGPIFAKLRANADQIKTLSVIRDTLLPKLMSGEIELPDAEAKTEEVL